MPKNWQQSLVDIFPRDPSMKVDSKIEELFISSFIACRSILMVPEYLNPCTQVNVGPYLIDWSVHLNNGKKLAVELDGHDFHEKTKEQASKDKRKDRALVLAGYTVVRFTGSDVWNNPFLCCRETVDHIHMLEHGKTLREARASAGMAAISKMFED